MNKHKQKIILIFVGLVLLTAATPGTSRAASPSPSPVSGNQYYTLLEPLPCVGNTVNCTQGQLQPSVDLNQYVQYAFNLMIALAAVAAVVMIVWGGFLYMGSDSWNKKKDGGDIARNAIYGLLLVLCTFIILKTVNPKLVQIPATLVTKLDTSGLPNDAIDPLTAQLASQKTQSDATNTENYSNLHAAETNTTNLTSEKTNLENKLRGYFGDPSLTSADINAKCLEIQPGLNADADTACSQLAQTNSGLASAIKTESDANDLASMNRYLNQALSMGLNNNLDTAAQKIAQINSTLKELSSMRDLFSAKHVSTGADSTILNNTANYTEAAINLVKVQIMINSATIPMSGLGGFASTNAVGEMLDTNGTKLNYTTKPEEKKFIQDTIAKYALTLQDLPAGPQLDDLTSKINAATAAMNAKFK